MKSVALLLVALAACAGLSSATTYSLPAMRYQGGYTCEGKIAKLDCYVPNGFVKGLVYQNTMDSEATAICDYPFVNGGPSWTNNMLELDFDETIIAVEACRGAFYGYTSITVTTDKNRTWTCGGNSNYGTRPPTYGNGCGGWSAYTKFGCFQPYDYTSKYGTGNKWGMKLTRGLLSADDVAVEGNEGRELLQGSEDDTFFFKKNWGWGWNTGKCQTYRSPKQPKWSTCGGNSCNKWYYGNSRRSGVRGYVTSGYKYAGWKDPNGIYSWTNGGKRTVYYKSPSLYNKYTTYCKSNNCGYTPADYWTENYPLASFSGICDKQGALYNLYGFCWNKDYEPPSPPSALVITMTFISDATQPCISITGQDIDVDAVTGQLRRYLSIVSPGLVRDIVYYTAGYSCTPGSGSTNATTTINFGFVPGVNKTIQDLADFFSAAGVGIGSDVCALPPVTDPVTEMSMGPCVQELYKGLVAAVPGSGMSKKSKKKVSVKASMDQLLKSSQYQSYYRKYNMKKAKKTDKAYSTRYYGSALYAKAYMTEFDKGYAKNMKKAYGKDYKQKMKKVAETYKTYKKKKGL